MHKLFVDIYSILSLNTPLCNNVRLLDNDQEGRYK